MVITADRPEFAGTADLLSRARAGDTPAFCRLAAEHERRLLQQACGLTHDRTAAEDLVSETLAEAWRSLSRYNGACQFSTWLFSILLHRHQKALRRARSRPIPLAALLPAQADEHRQAQENLPAADPSPAEVVMRAEAAGRIRQAVQTLPDKHQQVVLLRFFEEASLPEIAALLGCSVGTVKSRLHYALEKLREAQQGVNLSEVWGDTGV
ncbi:MAG TPA: sigma-70 family RNA polymerase sigma factor [Candidatus Paceibacterota bacterium]|nr:sigma-70 family RNA polymerase sigma factor [Verrucomicrobiota bacterium]HSA11658.1 sigma-70 family RNA polymerase sigma factor [Candidatus Paceibacterota bacterium]